MVQTPISPLGSSKKPSKIEAIKENSQALREPVATEILQDTNHFSEAGLQILKFHGSYQQDNRDHRIKGQDKDYQFMLRTRTPAGFVPAKLYLTLDRLADQYGNHTLRLTTRQGFQLHGILKQNLKTVLGDIIRNMGSTLGACGDLNRNVMAPPVPYKNRPEYRFAQEYAHAIADLLTPQTSAYYDIWLDGEKAVTSEVDSQVMAALQRNGNGTLIHDNEEPIYGKHYMPRKFKCCVTVPGDNSVDLYSQDVALVVITNEQNELQGFNVLAGGGLGRTHNKEETFARLADPIGYVEKHDIFDLVKAIVATQRDYGDRATRRHARMKYLIHDWGVEKFRQVLEDYFGKSLLPYKSLPPFIYHDYLGWHDQGDGNLFLGISIENGRVKDDGKLQLKAALKEIEQRFELPLNLTPNHNLILSEINPDWKAEIQEILDRCGIIAHDKLDPLTRYSMACPALPTCGLAIAESERALPGVLHRIRALLKKLKLQDEAIVIRMTGCPNGCARPYLAELGFVGQMPGQYQVWLGADSNQTRLSEPFLDKMPVQDLEKILEPVFAFFKKNRLNGESPESFGDFCHRVGFEALRQFATTYKPMSDSTAPKSRHRIGIRQSVYDKLKVAAERQGKSMTEVVNAAVEAYLPTLQYPEEPPTPEAPAPQPSVSGAVASQSPSTPATPVSGSSPVAPTTPAPTAPVSNPPASAAPVVSPAPVAPAPSAPASPPAPAPQPPAVPGVQAPGAQAPTATPPSPPPAPSSTPAPQQMPSPPQSSV